MKIKIFQIMLIFFSISIYAQEGLSTDAIIKNLNNSNYIFEGVIETVDFYAADNQGNKIPNSSAKFENGAGYFYNEDGSDAKCFSLAKIKLNKVYKGLELSSQEYAYILTTSSGLQIFVEHNGNDFVTKQFNFSNSHEKNVVIMSPMVGYKMIFFCNKNQDNKFILEDDNSLIYFNSLYSKNDSNSVYAGSNINRFYSEKDLNDFLSTIKNINVKDKSLIEKKNAAVNTNTIKNEEFPKINHY